MAVFLSVLRGINVSGQRKVPMAQLQALYERLGFTSVTTYIQSGNVIFEHDTQVDLASRLEAEIKHEFGFEVPVIIRTKQQVQAIVADNPFLQEKGTNPAKLHVTLLSSVPEVSLVNSLALPEGSMDRFTVLGQDIYLQILDSYGSTKLNNAFFERKLKQKATTRNWNTMQKLEALMAAR